MRKAPERERAEEAVVADHVLGIEFVVQVPDESRQVPAPLRALVRESQVPDVVGPLSDEGILEDSASTPKTSAEPAFTIWGNVTPAVKSWSWMSS